MIRKNAYAFLLFFLAAGLLVSLYALKQHYAPLGTSVCNVGGAFNCDLVNKGPYGDLAGFPVAGLGVLGYVTMGLAAMIFSKTKSAFFGQILLGLLAGSLAFTAYLTYLEAFVIHAWCLICLASASCIVGASVSGWMTYRQFAPTETAKA